MRVIKTSKALMYDVQVSVRNSRVLPLFEMIPKHNQEYCDVGSQSFDSPALPKDTVMYHLGGTRLTIASEVE